MPTVNRRNPPSSPRGLALDVVRLTAATTVNANHIDAVLQVDSGSNVTITLPKNLPVGFHCMVEQAGAGVAIIAAATGATLVNVSAYDRTAGQYAVIGLYVRANVDGQQAVWNLTGAGGAA